MTSMEIYSAVYKILRKSGVPAASKSNPVIAEAVVQYRSNPQAMIGLWTKVLLPDIGSVFGISGVAAERLITRAFDACYKYDEAKTLCELLNVPLTKMKARSLIIALSEVIG